MPSIHSYLATLLLLSGYSIVNEASLAETVVSSVIPSSGGSNSELEALKKKMNNRRKWYDYYEKGECQASVKGRLDGKIRSSLANRKFNKERAAETEKVFAPAYDDYCLCVAVSLAEAPEVKESNLKDLLEDCDPVMLRRISYEMYRMYGP